MTPIHGTKTKNGHIQYRTFISYYLQENLRQQLMPSLQESKPRHVDVLIQSVYVILGQGSALSLQE